MNIEALPSYWRGTVFRSRTEARWAVFFDAIGLRWEYEPEGLDLAPAYLPDFWLPDMRHWVEVKPDFVLSNQELRNGTDARMRVPRLVRGTGHPCLLLRGAPWPITYLRASLEESPDGLALTWRWASFDDRYTLNAHGQAPRDGQPRMFLGDDDAGERPWDKPPALSDCFDSLVTRAMDAARRMDLKEPDAGDYLPMGWEGIEPAWEGTELTQIESAATDDGVAEEVDIPDEGAA